MLAFPVRCVDAQLLDNGTYHTTERLQARAHMWASVAHKGTRLQPLACMWCTSTVTPQTAGLRHDVWFVGLITRVRAAPRAQWPNEPKWTPPLLIYESHPRLPGEPNRNWPRIHPHARYGRDEVVACDPAEQHPAREHADEEAGAAAAPLASAVLGTLALAEGG